MSSEVKKAGPGHRIRIPFYDDVLRLVEIWFVVALLGMVVLSTFVNILDRNFGLGLWEYAVIEKMIYSSIFFIGVFGAVIASRRVEHIAIDAVAHFLPQRVRYGLSCLLQMVAAVVCFLLARACIAWILDVIGADATLLAGRTEWWLKTRLWRWPIAIGLGLMSLHFFVNGVRFGISTVKMEEPKAASDEAEGAD